MKLDEREGEGGVVIRNLKVESFKGFLSGGLEGADEYARGALSEVVGRGKRVIGGLGRERNTMKGGSGADCSGEVGDGGFDEMAGEGSGCAGHGRW